MEKLEQETDVLVSAKYKEKSRRRSSIFSLLKRQKKLTRQYSEPSQMISRKFSVDSAILNHFNNNSDKVNGDDALDLSPFGG